ncbi:OmpW/AlkL family protein [Notoacmeibacter ruber]|uniref:OmpW family protein n=1 Tax=Notoacmeibacter ruber TaxID=2670375 RepID=A0A3L7JDY7_9HYPH|nr:OmpW family protein [Notoacmeibacter ruber]RLQ88529.1 OmpW family protein [Notoacmeibacter ruber]
MLSKTLAQTGIAALGLLLAGPVAQAADYQVVDYTEAPVAASRWQVRARAVFVGVEDEGGIDDLDDSELDFSDTVIPEIDISYFFTPNIAAELILGTTYTDVSEEGLGLGDVGSTWVLPPTLLLQYHFTNFGKFQPYVGAGINYTIFYEEEGEGALASMDIDDAFGAAVQVGFDYMVNDHWGVNFDVKKLFLETEWEATTVAGDELTGDANINPWLIGAGVTYRF